MGEWDTLPGAPGGRRKPIMRVGDMLGSPETWARRLGWATLAGAGLGVLGPFGSFFEDGVVARVAYYTGLAWTGAVAMGLTVGPAIRAAPRLGVPPPFAAGAATNQRCGPLAAFVAVLHGAAWRGSGLRPLDWYAQTLFIAAPLVAAAWWLESGRATPRTREAPGPSLQEQAPPRLEGDEGLPARLRDAALCLQMEDHYVRVHTLNGSELRLLSMKAASQAMGEARGDRVHRSWWVARSAVTAAEMDGRTTALLLTNGLRVPVARNRVAVLKERGWL